MALVTEPYCDCLQAALGRLCDELPSELDRTYTPHHGVSGARVVLSPDSGMRGWRWADMIGGMLEITLGDYGHSEQVGALREYVIDALTLDFRYREAAAGPNPTSI